MTSETTTSGSRSTARLLLLGDSRFPAGGHAHSGGVEEAIMRSIVTDGTSLAAFLAGRLATCGVVAASTAASVCHMCRSHRGPTGPDPRVLGRLWSVADAEVEARTTSPARRSASRTQGAQLLRAALTVLGGPVLRSLRDHAGDETGPHHTVVLGAACASADLTPVDAATAAAYLSVSGPASAAVRLIGIDPFEAAHVLATLADDVDGVASAAAEGAGRPLEELPAPSAPVNDLLAEAHIRRKERLFAS